MSDSSTLPTGETIYTTTADIAEAITARALQKRSEVKIKFKAAADPAWLYTRGGDTMFVDGDRNRVSPINMAIIASGSELEGIVPTVYTDRPIAENGEATDRYLIHVSRFNGEESIYVNPKHIAELVVYPAPTIKRADGLQYDIVVRRNSLEIYGHTVTKAGVLKALRTFAERLGCTLTQSTKTIAFTGKPSDRVTTSDPQQVATAFNAIRASGKEISGPMAVKFKPVTDPIWRRDDMLRDAYTTVSSRFIIRLIDNATFDFKRVMLYEGHIRFDDGAYGIHVTPEYVESIDMPEPTRSSAVQLDGISGSNNTNWLSNGGLKVGCQNITPQGVMEIFLILAAFCGYEILDPVGIAAENKMTYTPPTPKSEAAESVCHCDACRDDDEDEDCDEDEDESEEDNEDEDDFE